MSKWHVICTRRGWEKKVEELLAQKGFEIFCPQIRVKRKWSDRVKTIGQPLFDSLIFVKITDEHRQNIRMTQGVKNFLYANGKPAIIRKKEVEALRQVLCGYHPVSLIRLACSENHPEFVWNEEGSNGKLQPGTKLKKARISIGGDGYEIWAVKATAG